MRDDLSLRHLSPSKRNLKPTESRTQTHTISPPDIESPKSYPILLGGKNYARNRDRSTHHRTVAATSSGRSKCSQRPVSGRILYAVSSSPIGQPFRRVVRPPSQKPPKWRPLVLSDVRGSLLRRHKRAAPQCICHPAKGWQRCCLGRRWRAVALIAHWFGTCLCLHSRGIIRSYSRAV
jgi:hypothetical protein